jgi:hypothetical protein
MSLPSSQPGLYVSKPEEIPIYSSLTSEEEPVLDKLARKAKQQPWVPLGCALTVGALYMSGRALRRGQKLVANRMFMWRVLMQGFTVAGLVFGGYLYGKPNRPTDRDAILYAKAKEREKMWIEELERIDEEDKTRKERAMSIQEAFLKRREDSEREAEDKASGLYSKRGKEPNAAIKEQNSNQGPSSTTSDKN